MYWSETLEEGYLEFDSLAAASSAADRAATLDREQVPVYDSADQRVYLAGPTLPTHEQRCMYPEIYGYDD